MNCSTKIFGVLVVSLILVTAETLACAPGEVFSATSLVAIMFRFISSATEFYSSDAAYGG